MLTYFNLVTVTFPIKFGSLFPAPGGILINDGDQVCKTDNCVFGQAHSMEKVKAWEQVFVKLVRR